jgi:hypothetical protein
MRDASGVKRRSCAVQHLLSGPAREREKENPARLHPLVNQPRHSVRQRVRLARARARDDKQRPVTVSDGLELLRIQSGKPVGKFRHGKKHTGISKQNTASKLVKGHAVPTWLTADRERYRDRSVRSTF